MKDTKDFGYIYLTTNKVNGKIYVGQCYKTPEETKSYLGSGTLIKRAIKKYGKKNFSKKTLSRCGNQDCLDAMEEYNITRFDACNPEIGYNILPGSSNKFISGSPMLIPLVAAKVSKTQREFYHTEQGKIKAQEISKSKKLFYQTEQGIEVKKILSEINFANDLSGINNPNFQNYWDDDQKENMSIKMTGRYVKENNPNWQNWWNEEQLENQQRRFRENGHPCTGRIWINNGIKNGFIFKEELIPQGYKIGRMKFKTKC